MGCAAWRSSASCCSTGCTSRRSLCRSSSSSRACRCTCGTPPYPPRSPVGARSPSPPSAIACWSDPRCGWVVGSSRLPVPGRRPPGRREAMSDAELLGGAAMFTAVGAAAATASWRFLRRWAPGLDPFERTVGVALVGVVLILAIHLVPLALGVLDRVSVLVTAFVVAAAGLAVRPARVQLRDPPRPPAAADGAPARVLAGFTAFAVLVAALADFRTWLPQVVQGLDSLTFHLPNAARWIQSGSLWQVDEFLPLQSHGSYPNNGEVLFTWAMLPFHDDVLVRPMILAILVMWAFTTVVAARELGAPPGAGLLAACALVSIPIVADATVPRAMADVVAYFGLTAGLLFLLRFARADRRSDLVLAGLGISLAACTKWYAVPGALTLIGILAGCRRLAEIRWRA